MPSPVLYVFAISHYCEKARWSLDHHGIAYRLTCLPPGGHRQTANKLGARHSSLPILDSTRLLAKFAVLEALDDRPFSVRAGWIAGRSPHR